MEIEVLKKKLETYRTPKGQIRNVNSELLIELLRMWEQNTGPSSQFAKLLGMKGKQLARMIGEARKIAKVSDAIDTSFHEVSTGGNEDQKAALIEIVWNGDKLIRFSNLETLLQFLKQAA